MHGDPNGIDCDSGCFPSDMGWTGTGAIMIGMCDLCQIVCRFYNAVNLLVPWFVIVYNICIFHKV